MRARACVFVCVCVRARALACVRVWVCKINIYLSYSRGIRVEFARVLRTLLIAVRLCDNGFAVTDSPLRIWKWLDLSNERSGIAFCSLLFCLRIRSFRLVFITRLNEKAANLKNVKSS